MVGCLVLVGGVSSAAVTIHNALVSVDAVDPHSLIAHWKLDGNLSDSSASAQDLTGNSVTAVAGHDGGANGALGFNGTNSYAAAPSTQAFNMSSYSNRTILLRFKVSGSAGDKQFLYEESDAANGITVYLDETSAGQFDLVATTVGNGWGMYGATKTGLTTGAWYTVALIVTNDNPVQLYVDGQAADTGTGGDTATIGAHDSDAPVLGASHGVYNTAWTSNGTASSGYGNFFNGSLDDVHIFDRALTEEQAATVFSSGDNTESAPPLSIGSALDGLVGYWKLDGNAKDSTPFSHNGMILGATSTADRKGNANKAFLFDNDDHIAVANTAKLQLTGDMSISFWASVSDDNSFNGLVSKGSGHEYEVGDDFRSGLTGSLTWRSTSSGTVTSFPDYFDGYLGTPVFVTVTVSGQTLKVYRNGLLFATANNIGARSASSNDLFFGCRPEDGVSFCANSTTLDDIRIYDRVLSLEEIQSLAGMYDSQLNLSGSSN